MDLKRSLTYPLRLCPSIRTHAELLAKQDGISLNHFISLAVAEKLSRLEHESWTVARQPSSAVRSGHPSQQHMQRNRLDRPNLTN